MVNLSPKMHAYVTRRREGNKGEEWRVIDGHGNICYDMVWYVAPNGSILLRVQAVRTLWDCFISFDECSNWYDDESVEWNGIGGDRVTSSRSRRGEYKVDYGREFDMGIDIMDIERHRS